MKIYFAGSIRAGRGDQELYQQLIRCLQPYGQVLTEHVGDSGLTQSGDDGPSDQGIYARDTSWLAEADLVVAEVSTPSLGVGYELGRAEALGKPALCLYREQEGRRLSAMVSGNPQVLVARYQTVAEAMAHIHGFLRDQGHRDDRPVTFAQLDQEDKLLLTEAAKALDNAYPPYSGFHVGSAILTRGGTVVTGANVENSAYGESICAERCALMRANAQGFGDLCVAIAVVARKGKDESTKHITAPCGACRQVIYEFACRSCVVESFRVILATTDFDQILISTIGTLLPLAFGPDDLKA